MELTHVKVPIETFNKVLAVLSRLPWQDVSTLMSELSAQVESIEVEEIEKE